MTIEIEAKVGKRGQVVIPKPIREKYDLKPGTTVTFGIEDGEVVIRGSEGVLEEYLTAIPKREEPDEIDWDARHYERFG